MNQIPSDGDTHDSYWTPRPPSSDQSDPNPTSLALRSYWLDSRIVTLEAGPFDATHLVGCREESFGILILDGLIMAQLEVGRAHAGWLVGAEDLLRPWQMRELSLLRDVRWHALTPSRVLRVDRGYRRLEHDPRFVQKLLDRAARTSHWLFAMSLVISSPSIEDRLLLLFSLWGERWGKVTPAGIWIELPLTHQLIAQMCGARRPTVSIALRSLGEQGVITRRSRSGWLLRRLPEVNGCDCRSQYTASLGPALGIGRALEAESQ